MKILPLVAMIMAIGSSEALAQAQTAAPTGDHHYLVSDLSRYCVWDDKLYSAGAMFCVAKNTAVRCGPPEGAVVTADQSRSVVWQSFAATTECAETDTDAPE